MLNKVQAIGNLGANPEIRNTQGGQKVANFRIACTEKWTDKQSGERKERTEWISVVVWGATADVVEKYCTKGSRVYIEGKLQTRKWQDQSGADRYTTEVVLQGFGSQLLLLSARENGGDSQAQTPAASSAPKGYAPSNGAAAKPAARQNIDDEIPF